MGHSPSTDFCEGGKPPLLRVDQCDVNATEVSPAGGVDVSGKRTGP